MNEITRIEEVEPPDRRDRASGTLSLRASADTPGPETDQALGGAKAHGIGDAGFGNGVDRSGNHQSVVACLGVGLGDAGVNPVFTSDDDNDPGADDDAYGASASCVSGPATFTASPRTMTTRITAELAPLSTLGDDTRATDLPAAESARPKHKLESGDMCTFDVKADGFIHHDRQLKIAMPPEPGRLIAGQVADPVPWNAPDICTESAMERGWPIVAAKPTMQDGPPKTLCIMDERKIDAPSGVAELRTKFPFSPVSGRMHCPLAELPGVTES